MTTIARKTAAAAKLKLENEQYLKFAAEVLLPTMSRTTLGWHERDALAMPVRAIQDRYGRAASRAFKLLFKMLQRGGRATDGTTFKSKWVYNPAMMQPLIEYTEGLAVAEPRTCKALEQHLIASGAMELQWYKAQGKHEWSAWVTKEQRDEKMEKKRAKDRKAAKDLEEFRAMKMKEREEREEMK